MNNHVSQHKAHGRIEAFDSLRGVAAIGVVFWHYGAHFDAEPFRSVFSLFYRAGYLLVDFFFVLSGYVISRSYWRESRRLHIFGNIWSRVARLYPLHLVTLLSVAIMQWILSNTGLTDFMSSNNDIRHFLLNIFLLNGIGLQNGFSFNGPAWSISTEFVVNCVFMAFIAGGLLVRVSYIIIGMLAAVILYSISHIILQNNHVLGYLDPQLVRCSLGFSFGVIIQLIDRRQWAIGLKIFKWVPDIFATISLTGVAVFLNSQHPHAGVSSYLVIMILSAALLLSVRNSQIINRLLQIRPLVFLGDISYSVYLTHFPIQVAFVLFCALSGRALSYESPLVALTYFGMVIFVSSITYRKIEIPCQKFLKGLAR